ncbi:MAG: methytransferase partner Trm112 [Halobacteriota archaeon]|nr:methytransferase partner Trm112 [Halobacteriota archaeon]
MKKELMDILACPVCKSDLSLTIGDEDGEEILTGTLHCEKCNYDYPIKDSIPNLLPPNLQEK